MLSLHSQNGTMAEWLGNGLQNRLQQFDSAWYLQNKAMRATSSLFIFEVS